MKYKGFFHSKIFMRNNESHFWKLTHCREKIKYILIVLGGSRFIPLVEQCKS